MNTFFRWLVPLGIGALFLALVLLVSGCAGMRPDYVTGALVHQSSPLNGPYPAPLGDNGRTPESTLNGVQVGAEWERGRLFWDGSLTYAVRERNMEGGPWYTAVRVGYRVGLP